MYIHLLALSVMLTSTFLEAHVDLANVESVYHKASTEDRIIFEELKTAYEKGFFSEETVQKNPILDTLPEWAEGNRDMVQRYYSLHAESSSDKLLGGIACKMGIIVHGDMNQNQLAAHLASFDILRLLSSGPYRNTTLSIQAQRLVYEGLQLPKIYDIHIHNLGYDEDNYLNPKAAARGVAKWFDYFTFLVLRYAAGMSSPLGSTQEARKRIQLYAEHFPKLRGIILPIHQAFHADGKADWMNTGSYLPNEVAVKTAESYQSPHSQLIAAVSIHPFDSDWKDKMEKAYSKGIRLIKWMPPQSIPPDSPQMDDYYCLMKKLKMTLIAHAGPEHTIPTTKENECWVDLGNALRFRKPLQLGVNVILSHCGHRDLIPDLDDPEQPLVPGFELFLRIARESYLKNLTGEWEGKLFGDLAGVLAHYGVDFIRELLLNVKEDGVRLIYGSDFPHTNLIQPGKDAYDLCANAGLLDSYKVGPLKEIRNWNPLLANYIFARNLILKTNVDTILFPEKTFSGEMFESALRYE
jgi:uncharacterized protein